MYLKSIEVYGFKSFANKIKFEFKNGITGIVGPNGSGKSNVGDAVRWVLGEQSAKQLRGAKMEDVIFSGTESRKPLGSAYVAITLDNSDRKLSIDYDEVTVARRVYRSGESEYLINGATCRLKDVTNLFLDTGIGKEGYSIIGQGQIDKILSGKPEERRELFDEAAGIVKYKKNKAATEKALEGERQNLCRVTDILSELESQKIPLEKQAEKAKEYLQYKEKQKELDISVFLLEMKELNEEKQSLSKKLKINEEEIAQVRKQYDSMKEDYERLEKVLEENQQEIAHIQEQVQETSLNREKMEGEIKVLKEQMNTARNAQVHVEENTKRIQVELEKRQEEKGKYQEEQKILEEEKQKLEKQSVQTKAERNQQEQFIQKTNQSIEREKQKIVGQMNEVVSLKGKLQRYETMEEQLQLRKTELNQRFLHYKSQAVQQKEQLEQLIEEERQAEESLQKLKEEWKNKENNIWTLQKELEEERNHFTLLQREYHRAESQLETVRNMTERYEGYGNSIKKVMEQKARQKGIHGVVADLIKTETKFEVAIETALGGSIQNIVTENEEVAKGLIAYLKENRFGRATFLPLTSVKGKGNSIRSDVLKEQGVLGVASSLVQSEPIYSGIIEHLLGRIVVVDTIDHAIVINRKYQYSLRIVTLDGESLSVGGAMTGGAFRNNSNLLGRRRELEELEEKKQSIKKEQQEVEQKILSLEEEKGKQKQLLELEQGKKQQLELQLNTLRLRRTNSEEQQKEQQLQQERLTRESKEMEQQSIEIKESKQSIDEQIKRYEEEQTACETRIKEWEEQVKVSMNKKIEEENDIHKLDMEILSKKQSLDFLITNLKRIEAEELSLQEERESYIEKANSSKGQMSEIEVKIEQLGVSVKDASEKVIQLKEILKEKEEKRQEFSSSHKQIFEKREGISNQLNGLDKETYRLQGNKEKVEEKIGEKTNYMWEEYELTYGSLLSKLSEITEPLLQLKQKLAQIKQQIKGLGDVNVNAIEDYKAVAERFEFLTTQKEDILQAEANLLQIIQELDIAMRQQFSEKFAEIQKMFQKVFCELFGGGKATLELMEDEDVLEAGIRIISQPPGKKLQNMMQLSGGEKALTAIALLFAIQSLKPSPFCLLDEIEAALDDSNVDRFAKYLHKLTKDTQFIVITHRRGTMVAADVLYGITMQEKGVSALVSVNLIENQLEE